MLNSSPPSNHPYIHLSFAHSQAIPCAWAIVATASLQAREPFTAPFLPGPTRRPSLPSLPSRPAPPPRAPPRRASSASSTRSWPPRCPSSPSRRASWGPRWPSWSWRCTGGEQQRWEPDRRRPAPVPAHRGAAGCGLCAAFGAAPDHALGRRHTGREAYWRACCNRAALACRTVAHRPVADMLAWTVLSLPHPSPSCCPLPQPGEDPQPRGGLHAVAPGCRPGRAWAGEQPLARGGGCGSSGGGRHAALALHAGPGAHGGSHAARGAGSGRPGAAWAGVLAREGRGRTGGGPRGAPERSSARKRLPAVSRHVGSGASPGQYGKEHGGQGGGGGGGQEPRVEGGGCSGGGGRAGGCSGGRGAEGQDGKEAHAFCTSWLE